MYVCMYRADYQIIKKNIYIYSQNSYTTRKTSSCGGCKNCRYMSPIAARFSPAAIHEIYCGVFCDRRYR